MPTIPFVEVAVPPKFVPALYPILGASWDSIGERAVILMSTSGERASAGQAGPYKVGEKIYLWLVGGTDDAAWPVRLYAQWGKVTELVNAHTLSWGSLSLDITTNELNKFDVTSELSPLEDDDFIGIRLQNDKAANLYFIGVSIE